MLKVLLIIAYTLPTGELGLEITPLKECPDKTSFQQFMNEQVEQGQIKLYSVSCRPLIAGQDA